MTLGRTVFFAATGAAVYATITLAPIVREPGSVLCAYDHPGDAMISIWSTWVRLGALDGRWPLERVPLVAAPAGVNLRQSPPEPAVEWPQVWLARWLGEVPAFNVHLWLTFPLAAAAMALLVWELTETPAAAVVSGLLYALAPYHAAHSMQVSLASIQWLPLALWSWVWLAKRPGWRRALVHVGCCGLVVWTSAYYALLLAAASLVVVPWLWRRPGLPSPRPWAFLGWGAVAVGVVAAVSWIWYHPFLMTALRHSSLNFAERYTWPMKHLFVYAAKPWDYLVPSVHHPWLGPLVRPFVTAHLYGSNIVEQSLYLGYGALGLALSTVIMGWARRRADPRTAWALGFLATLGIVGLWCSAPPLVPLGPFRIEQDLVIAPRALYFPSAFLYHAIPFFRVYARFGLLVILAVAALAGIGWAAWQGRAVFRRRGAVALAIVGAFLAADYAVAIPWVRVNPPPAVYAWLAREPGNPIIVEYPFLPSTHALHAEYLFAQRVHQKRMLNGAFERTPAPPDDAGQAGPLRAALADLAAPGAPAMLRDLGVTFVIVHRDRYAAIPTRPKRIRVLGVTYDVPQRHKDETLSPPPREIPGLRPVAKFGETMVYAVEP